MPATIQKLKESDTLFLSVKDVLEHAHSFAFQSVNFAMVNCYFAIGKLIVENEQRGHLRAAYAKKTLKKLSRKLTRHFNKGYSVDNLENMRRFYLVYGSSSQVPISETLSRKSSFKKNNAQEIRDAVSDFCSTFQTEPVALSNLNTN